MTIANGHGDHHRHTLPTASGRSPIGDSSTRRFAQEVSVLTSPSTDRNREPRPDLATVESRRNDLVPEEFPEGPYGSPYESPGKSSPWRPEQRSPSAYAYENRQLHAGLARDYPQDHDLHDETGPPSGDGE